MVAQPYRKYKKRKAGSSPLIGVNHMFRFIGDVRSFSFIYIRVAFLFLYPFLARIPNASLEKRQQRPDEVVVGGLSLVLGKHYFRTLAEI